MSNLFGKHDLEFTKAMASSDEFKAAQTLYANQDLFKDQSKTLKIVI